jgi:hypothetical protein
VEKKFTGDWRALNKEELHDLHSPPITSIRGIRSMEEKKMGGVYFKKIAKFVQGGDNVNDRA